MRKASAPNLVLSPSRHSNTDTSNTLPPIKKRLQLFPVKPQKRIEADTPKRIRTGLKQLEVQAEQINQLSRQLEAAIRKLKAIATAVDEDRRFLHKRRHRREDSICEYRNLSLPVVRQKSSGRIVLMSRSINSSTERKTTLQEKKPQRTGKGS